MVENLDLALLVGGLALSQVDSATPLGTTLRVTGNVTSTVATEVVIPVAKTTSNFYVRIPSHPVPSRPIPSHPGAVLTVWFLVTVRVCRCGPYTTSVEAHTGNHAP